jgi:immune inhibitor A
MAPTTSRLKLPIIIFGIISLLFSACSTPAETGTPTSPTEVIQETPTSVPEVPTPLPTREAIPEGLIQVPVPDSAVQTAAELFNAERPPVDRIQLAREYMGVSDEELTPQIPEGTDFQVNDRGEFIFRKNLGSPSAPDYQPIPVRLRHISENAYWWTSVNATFANDEEIVAAANNFEEEILPINRLIFGKEWSPGIDGDPRIHILMVQEEGWGNIFGYFSVVHEYPKSVEPASNEKEMFFVNLGPVALDSAGFAGELSHELHHLIHWNQDQNEDLWFQEAMSELAKFLVGAGPSRSRGSNNAELFAEDPTIPLTSWPERSDQLSRPHYGAVWLFSVYLLEQFGPDLVKNIVQNPAPGVIGIQEELAKLPNAPSFEDIYADWIVANLLNMPIIYEGQFGYQEITPANIIYQPVQLFNGEPISESLPPYGSQYYLVSRDQPVEVNFTGSTLARLTPVDPYAGEYVWYSNRGDETDFTLTRTFDLSDLDSATFEYQTWYELDNFFDYTYLEASTDGGETWDVIETNHGTDENPIGNSLGYGYTGSSLEWLPESVDLSPYTGQEIQLRFHMITDLSTTRDGFQIDEISIPELGYYDGAEDDSGGWEARGFVRSSNFVPAEWIVWLITSGNPPQVHRIEVNPDQTAAFDIPGLGTEYPRAAVIVSPTAPTTTLELDYELVFQHP